MSEEKLEKYWNKVYYDYLEPEEVEELIDYYNNMEQENKQLKEEKNKLRDYIVDQLKEYEKGIEDYKRYGIEDYTKGMTVGFKKCLEILENKKIEEITLFEGTLEQLNNLSITGDKQDE